MILETEEQEQARLDAAREAELLSVQYKLRPLYTPDWEMI